MMNPATYHESVTLKNGLQICIRAVRPDDKDKILHAFNELEPESIYTRFFQAKKTLTDEELKTSTEIDFENIVGLVVTIEEKGSEIIIGGGRYSAFDPPDGIRSAEVSFTVEEDYNGLGIASRLLQNLAIIARAKGVSQFLAEVLNRNHAMVHVFARSGLPMHKQHEDDVIHLTLSLTEETA